MTARRKSQPSSARKKKPAGRKVARKDLPAVKAGKVIGGIDSSYSTSNTSFTGTSASPVLPAGTAQGFL